MVYTEQTTITSVEEVKDFFSYLVFERHCNFHPDDDFTEYVFKSDNTPMFNSNEVILFNRLMDECFTVCDKQGISIYDLGIEELRKFIRG